MKFGHLSTLDPIPFKCQCGSAHTVPVTLEDVADGIRTACYACQPKDRPRGYADWYRVRLKLVPEWQSNPDAFFKHVGEKPKGLVLLRADPSKPYGPENGTRWGKHSELKRKPRTTKPKIPDYTIRYNAKRRRWLCGGHLFPTEALARAFAQENEF